MFTLLANPARFEKFARPAAKICGGGALILLAAGLYFALFASPEDYQQGHSVRILYVHVPAAWTAMMAYSAMAVASFIYYVWRHVLADYAARACALPGAIFTALALITGGLWGKTSWGAYWVWDGRTVSVLILLFMFLGYIAFRQSLGRPHNSARIAALAAMLGAPNLIIIKYSVDWWNTLHQPATVSSPGSPGIGGSMGLPWMLMALAYTLFFVWIVLTHMRTDIRDAAKARPRTKPASAQLEDLLP